jgi:DNA-binding transcriptional LysR family regulator
MSEKQLSFPPLAWLRAFEAAARRLSFTGAASEIGLTQAAVSQQIRLLESRLRVKLFRRMRRGVELTAEGAAYLPHVQSGFALMSRSTRELFGNRGGGHLAVSSPISFAALWLAPRLKSFQAARPDVTVELRTIHLPQDYEAGEADLEIRFGARPFAGREAVQLTIERLVPVASPLILTGRQKGSSWTGLPRLTLSGGRSGLTSPVSRRRRGRAIASTASSRRWPPRRPGPECCWVPAPLSMTCCAPAPSSPCRGMSSRASAGISWPMPRSEGFLPPRRTFFPG